MDSITEFLTSIPPVTRYTTGTALVFFLISSLPFGIGHGFSTIVALVPANTISNMHLWNLLSGALYVDYYALGVIVIPLFYFSARWLEQAWGSKAFIAFLGFVAGISALSTYISLISLYAMTRFTGLLFANVSGLPALVVANAVGIKQIIPDHELKMFSMNVGTRYLPILLTALYLTLAILQMVHVGVFLYSVFSLIASWIFLRYIQWNDGVRGDNSDSFEFQNFFPNQVVPVVNVILVPMSMMFNRLFPKPGEAAEEDPFTAVRNVNPIDAERRRHLAMQVLESRMEEESETSLPEEEKDEDV